MTGSSALRVGAMAALVGALSLAAVRCEPRPSSPKARANITLVYVGAEDCGPCRAWQSMEGKRFLESPEFSRLIYREVKSPTLRDVLKDEHWPEDLRASRSLGSRGRRTDVARDLRRRACRALLRREPMARRGVAAAQTAFALSEPPLASSPSTQGAADRAVIVGQRAGAIWRYPPRDLGSVNVDA